MPTYSSLENVFKCIFSQNPEKFDRVQPYTQKHTGHDLYTYMSLVCKYSFEYKSADYSCLVLAQVGETVSVKVVCTHQQFFANFSWDIALKNKLNHCCSFVLYSCRTVDVDSRSKFDSCIWKLQVRPL